MACLLQLSKTKTPIYNNNNNKLSLQQIVKESPQSYSIQYILHLYIYNASTALS
jgi:hypothetical protein